MFLVLCAGKNPDSVRSVDADSLDTIELGRKMVIFRYFLGFGGGSCSNIHLALLMICLTGSCCGQTSSHFPHAWHLFAWLSGVMYSQYLALTSSLMFLT